MSQTPEEATAVLVESVVPLNQTETSALADLLKTQLGEIEIIYQLNSSLIGGIRVSYSGKVLDLSVSKKLDYIHQKLSAYASK